MRIELASVRRTNGGRIHLTPRVPDDGPVLTLCDRTLAAGSYRAVADEADCQACLRRRDDPARVSGAFFRSDVGAELLERSLEQARQRRQEPRERSEPASPPPRPRVLPGTARPAASSRTGPPSPSGEEEEPAEVAEQAPSIPELRGAAQLRKAMEHVYVTPGGVMIRLADGHAGHVTFTGAVDIRRRGGTLTIRLGDVVLEFELR